MRAATLSSFDPGPHQALDPSTWRRTLPPATLAILLFLVDVRTPNGVVDGFPYVLAVLLCWWIPSARAPLFMAAALMPMMLLGYEWSPTVSPAWVAVTNRLVAGATVWMTAIVLWHNARTRHTDSRILSQNEARLEAAQISARADLSALSQWLRDDVELELRMVEWRLNRLQGGASRPADIGAESFILRQAVQRAREAVLAKAARLEC